MSSYFKTPKLCLRISGNWNPPLFVNFYCNKREIIKTEQNHKVKASHSLFVKPLETLKASSSHIFQPHSGFACYEHCQASGEALGRSSPFSTAGSMTLKVICASERTGFSSSCILSEV